MRGTARAEQGPRPPGPCLQAGPTFWKKAWGQGRAEGRWAPHLPTQESKLQTETQLGCPRDSGGEGPAGWLQGPGAPTAPPPASGFRVQLLSNMTRYLCNLHFSAHVVIFTSSLSSRRQVFTLSRIR